MMTSSILVLAQNSSGSSVGGMLIFLIYLAIIIGVVAGFWKCFQKAGQPGWAAIIPIYNIYILCKIAGRPAWWVILFFVPIVSLIAMVLVSLDVAKSFGKSAGFGVGLALLGFIFYPLLGFGDAQYQGPAAAK